MGFGEEIGEVVVSSAPFEDVVAHGYAFLEPVVLFGYHFGTFLFAGLSSDGACYGVVVDDDGGTLWMAHISTSLSCDFEEGDVTPEGCILRLVGAGAYGGCLLAHEAYGTVESKGDFRTKEIGSTKDVDACNSGS